MIVRAELYFIEVAAVNLWDQIQDMETHLPHFLVVSLVCGRKNVHILLCWADQAEDKYHHPLGFGHSVLVLATQRCLGMPWGHHPPSSFVL